MFLSDISIKRPIMISMGLIVFILFGTLAYFSLTLNLMPDVEFGFVTVQTIYPGAGPKETETQITNKIEDAVATISKIDRMRSFSMEGVSYIIIRFEMDKDPDIANQEVKDKVNGILNDLPRDAELPVVEKFDVSAFPIMEIVLTGELDMKALYELADKKLKDRLSQVEGVGKVTLTGGQEREIHIELDNRVVYQNAISLQQLSQILAAQNMDIPGGHFLQGTQEYSLRMKGEFQDLAAIEQLEIPTAFGTKKIGELGEVYDTGAEIRQRSTFFNNIDKIRESSVVQMSIIKSADGNTVEMAEAIRAELPELEKELPAGCRLSIVDDASLFIESSVNDTLSNIFLGVILTGLVLLFFLHDLRSTIIVAMAMPMSILSTFLLLQFSDFSLNIMTLMGLSTAVGILVTNSVIVLENIFRHKEMGHNRREAAGKGTAEIAVAVIASTMTNIVVFLPIAMMSGMVGQFFKEFALTVTYATIFSIIASFTITPMLASLILPKVDTKKHRIGERLEKIFHGWEIWYQNSLKFLLVNKMRSALSIAIAFGIFFITLFLFSKGLVGFEFMPMLDEGDIKIEVELPQGYNLDETTDLVQQIEQRLAGYEEVKQILTTLGSISQLDIGTNLALVNVKLIDVDERDYSSSEMAGRFIETLSDIPNAKIRVSAISSIGGGDAPVQFYLLGQDIEQLERYKRDVIDRIKDVPGLVNLNTSSRPGKPEITLIPDRKKIADAGLTIYDLAMALRSAVEGAIATRYREAGNEYDIRVSLSDETVDTPEKVGNITVVSRSGKHRLGDLADIAFSEGYSKVLHRNKFKSIEFSGFTAPDYPLGDIVDAIDLEVAEIEFAPGYKMQWGGEAEMMAESMMEMMRTFIIAIVLTYMLLAAILESLTQPLMILATIPLALIGVFLSLFATGKTMNVISMMAIIMLVGIVVNNAILLLDYTNILRRRGKNVHDALVEACPTKLKPIIMATVAIILGMLPLALGIGSSGVEIRQPMGIVSIGGLIISAIMTLFIIPTIYYLTTFSDKKSSKTIAGEADHV